MSDNIGILNNFIDAIKTDVINSIQANGRYATGQTVKELTPVISDNYAALLAPEYIDALEYGRKPTRPNAPTGDPTVFERIQEWCAAKGITDKGAAYAITKNIHKNGYPGKPGVLTEPLSDDNINAKLKILMEQIAGNEAEMVLELFD